MKRWLYVVETDCTDDQRLDEFRQWYDAIHIPDILKVKEFQMGARYDLYASNVKRGGSLAIYEIVADDIKDVFMKHRINMQHSEETGCISPLVKAIGRGVYSHLAAFENENVTFPEKGGNEYIFVIETNCNDSQKHEQFNQWYNEVHIPDLFETEGFVSGVRYRLALPQEGKAEYLAIYRIVTEDIDRMMVVLDENMKRKGEMGRFSPFLTSVSRSLFSLQYVRTN